MLVLSLFFASCNSDVIENNTMSKGEINTENMSKVRLSDTLNFQIVEGNYILNYSAKKTNDSIISSIEVLDSSTSLFTTSYNFDVSIDHWKLYRAGQVETEAEALKLRGISSNKLIDILDVLDESLSYIYSQILSNKNDYITSSIKLPPLNNKGSH